MRRAKSEERRAVNAKPQAKRRMLACGFASATALWAAQARGDFMAWTDTTHGPIAGAGVTLTGFADPAGLAITQYDLTGAAYAPAPGSLAQDSLNYLCTDNWTAAFGQPLTGVKLYAEFWRGTDGGASPVH